MALHGEGLLRIRYYRWAATTPLLASPDLTLALWHCLWDEGLELKYLCEHIGLAKIASRSAAIPDPDWLVERSLYAGFLSALTEEDRQDLLQLATDKVFEQALLRRFPALSAAPERVTLATLQQRVQTHVQKALALPVKLRESFITDGQRADFTLRIAVNKGGWQDLLSLSGARLKPLKRRAYQAMLEISAEELRTKLLQPGIQISPEAFLKEI